MDLFPERADPPGHRRLIVAALIASLAVHLAVGAVWGFFADRVVPVVAKLLPRPTPAPEIVALSDAITIEKRTVPRAARRTPRTQPVRQQPRRVAQEPLPRTPPVPTLPPIPTLPPTARPTTEPTTEPTYRPERGTIHHARAVPTEEPRPRELPTAVPPAPKNGFSQQQIAALDAQFSKTIAQAQRSLVDVPPQRRPPARAPDQIRYEAIMAGTPEQFLSAQGDCTSIIQEGHTATISYYYFRCTIRYSDGYFEDVSFLWPHVFPRGRDPVDLYRHGGVRLVFPMQAPPPGFVLPPHFALSRAICAFYRARCESVIERERANGNQPAPDPK